MYTMALDITKSKLGKNSLFLTPVLYLARILLERKKVNKKIEKLTDSKGPFGLENFSLIFWPYFCKTPKFHEPNDRSKNLNITRIK